MKNQGSPKYSFIEDLKIDKSQKAPKIEYPCEYPIKILGDFGDELQALVMAVVEKHSPGFDRSKIKVRDSKNGNFQAITVVITATGVDQLQNLFDNLKINPLVKIVL